MNENLDKPIIMRKFVPFLLFAILMSGCTVAGYYVLNLSEVERPQNANERYGEQKIINFKENNRISYTYEDELIKIVWSPHLFGFDFILGNKSDYSIKIIWDDAAYVNTKGVSGRVIHSGIKFTERNYPQPHTVIAKKTYLDDLLVPVENIYFNEGGLLSYDDWDIKPIFPNAADSKRYLEYLTKQYLGKTVKILLPLQVQETVNDYIFTFNITDFIIKKWSEW
jgi:hypothetical protein